MGLAPSPRRVDYVLESGMRIAGDAYGDPGAPPVVFLHGGGQTRHAWGGSAAAVAEAGHLAISLDHRGHGDSAWHPGGDYSGDGFVADLRGVLRQIAGRPFLVG